MTNKDINVTITAVKCNNWVDTIKYVESGISPS